MTIIVYVDSYLENGLNDGLFLFTDLKLEIKTPKVHGVQSFVISPMSILKIRVIYKFGDPSKKILYSKDPRCWPIRLSQSDCFIDV